MRKVLKVLTFVCAILLLAPYLTGCGTETEPTRTDDKTAGTSSAEDPIVTSETVTNTFELISVDFDGLCIGNIPITDCKIVISKDASAATNTLVKMLNSEIAKVYGAALPIVDDSTEKSDGEIVIGKTTREISKQTAGLTEKSAAMAVSENSVALDAATSGVLHTLITWFNTNYITGKPAVQLTADHSQRGDL
ncbi:MAG: hypothetical protein IIU58_02555, partial [Clostridia bacterium]|nr:hypothetical protein [Clostridia bacterium]